jgi:hypothetical protein
MPNFQHKSQAKKERQTREKSVDKINKILYNYNGDE